MASNEGRWAALAAEMEVTASEETPLAERIPTVATPATTTTKPHATTPGSRRELWKTEDDEFEELLTLLEKTPTVPTVIKKEQSSSKRKRRDDADDHTTAAACPDVLPSKATKKETKPSPTGISASSSKKPSKKELKKAAQEKVMSLHKPEKGEKRPCHAKSGSQAALDRLYRALSQRMFVVEQNIIHPMKRTFQVLGSTGNVYEVSIGATPACNCPDALKGNQCKHVMFVLSRVLGVPKDSPLVFQSGFLTSELKAMFEYHDIRRTTSKSFQRTLSNVEASKEVKRALLGANSAEEPEEEPVDPLNGKPRNDECGICYEDMDDIKKVTICPTCKNGLHTGCLKEMIKHRKSTEVPCPFCRESMPLADAAGSKASKKKTGVKEKEGYVNVQTLQPGTLRHRDTSTYVKNEWNGYGLRRSY